MALSKQPGPWHDDGSGSVLKVKAASEDGPTELVAEGSDSNEPTGFAEPQFSESPSDAPERTITEDTHLGKPEKNAKESGPVTVVGDWPPAPKIMNEDELAAEQEKEKVAAKKKSDEKEEADRKARKPAENKAAKPAATKGGK